MPKAEQLLFFPFYPDDFLLDELVERMTTEEVGAYWLLLCRAWKQSPAGSLPADDDVLAHWARLTPDRWAVVRPAVLAPFRRQSDGRFYQPRMVLEHRKSISIQRSRKNGGKAGAEKRWKSNDSNNINRSPIGEPKDTYRTPIAIEGGREEWREERKEDSGDCASPGDAPPPLLQTPKTPPKKHSDSGGLAPLSDIPLPGNGIITPMRREANAAPPPTIRPRAFEATRNMLIDWMHPCRLSRPPDEDLCSKLLAILGGDGDAQLATLAAWLKSLHGVKDPRSIQSWGWFVKLLQAEPPAHEQSA